MYYGCKRSSRYSQYHPYLECSINTIHVADTGRARVHYSTVQYNGALFVSSFWRVSRDEILINPGLRKGPLRKLLVTCTKCYTGSGCGQTGKTGRAIMRNNSTLSTRWSERNLELLNCVAKKGESRKTRLTQITPDRPRWPNRFDLFTTCAPCQITDHWSLHSPQMIFPPSLVQAWSPGWFALIKLDTTEFSSLRDTVGQVSLPYCLAIWCWALWICSYYRIMNILHLGASLHGSIVLDEWMDET